MNKSVQFPGLDNLIKKMGATKIPWELDQDISTIELTGPIEYKNATINSVLEDFKMDDKGIMYKDGRAWILYIMEPKNATIDDLKNNPKESNDVPRYHIIGNCRTMEGMRNKNRKDRYVTTDLLIEKFDVWGFERKKKGFRIFGGEGKREKITNVALGVCIHCLQRVNYNKIKIQKKTSNLKLREDFDVEKWFRENIQEKFIKPKYTSKNYPDPGYDSKFNIRAAELKVKYNWTCKNCKLNCSGSSDKRLIHCDHISGNTGDNSWENLRLLCIDCHRYLGQNKTVGSNRDFQKCVALKNDQNIKIFSKH